MAKILIVEDDAVISRNVKTWLESERHTVDEVANGDEGLYLLLNFSYDLAILDWQLPGKQGAEICVAVRAANNEIPILMLTSRGSLNDKVIGLDSGAYDYMVKPASLEELSARVRALLRRPADEAPELLYLGNVQINLNSHELLVNDARVTVSPSEFMILGFLCKNLGMSFSADTILARLWADKPNVSTPLVRVHITHLRQKLQTAGANIAIESQRGGGYMAKLSE